MISLTSSIDAELLSSTVDVVWKCSFKRYEQLRVFSAQDIEAVIALLPFHKRATEDYFILEELGLLVASETVVEEDN